MERSFNPATPVLNALIQSRTTLLTKTLPIFTTTTTTKSKNKSNQQQQQQPAHHLTTLQSNITTKIGPHQFLNTKISLCEWIDETQNNSIPTLTSSFSNSIPTSTPSTTTTITTKPAPITIALVTLLNEASLTDLNLANILKRAASGEASSEELKELTNYIEMMREKEEVLKAAAIAADAVVMVEGEGEVAAPAVVEKKREGGVLDEGRVVNGNGKETEMEMEVLPVIASTETNGAGLKLKKEVGIVLEFKENANDSSDTTSPHTEDLTVLLSFFVFPPPSPSASSSTTTKPSKLSSASFLITQEGKIPVPISFLIPSCPTHLKDQLLRASRNSRDRNEVVENWSKKMVGLIPARCIVIQPAPVITTPSIQTPQAMIGNGLNGFFGKGLEGVGSNLNSAIMSRASSTFSNTSLPPTINSTSTSQFNPNPLLQSTSLTKYLNSNNKRPSTSISIINNQERKRNSTHTSNTTPAEFEVEVIKIKQKPGPKPGSKSKKFRLAALAAAAASGTFGNSGNSSGSGESGSAMPMPGRVGGRGVNADGTMTKKPGPKRIRDRKAETARSLLVLAHAEAIANGGPLPPPLPEKRKRGKGKHNRVKIHPVE